MLSLHLQSLLQLCAKRPPYPICCELLAYDVKSQEYVFTEACDLPPIPRRCVIINGIMTRTWAHLSCAHADRVHISPEPLRLLAIGTRSVREIVQGEPHLAFVAMAVYVELRDNVSNIVD
jgi:hypothetical protein